MLLDGIDRTMIEAELGRKSLAEFIKMGWRILEPSTPYIHNWHVDAISEHLEAVSSGEIRNLIINIPPRMMKSLAVSVFWPVWCWIDNPSTRFLTASFRTSLAQRDAVKSRTLITSEWYQKRWGNSFRLSSDQNVKSRYENDRQGFRLITSVQSSVIGEGGDVRILDDPHDSKKIHSRIVREADLQWIKQSWGSRVNDPETSREVLVMQRLHQEDCTGYYLSLGGYEHLVLPMEYEPNRRCFTSIGFEDPRMYDGELLFSQRFSQETINKEKLRLGGYGTAGQLQQRPSPEEGGIIKSQWFKFWKTSDVDGVVKIYDGRNVIERKAMELPHDFDNIIQSWDMSFKGNENSDYVVCQVWAAKDANKFLLYQLRKKLNMPETIEAVKMVSQRFPSAYVKLIEDKANGPAVIDMLSSAIEGMIPITPKDSKVSRLNGVSPMFEAGNVYIPHTGIADWVEEYMQNFKDFPNAMYDDEVDATTQALQYLRQDDWVDVGSVWDFM